MSATWLVRYSDGSELHQYDKSSEKFIADAGEVPYRAIEWDRVVELTLSSAEWESRFTIAQPPEGTKLSLRSRHFRTQEGVTVPCFMVVQSIAGEEVTDESVQWVLYWLPNGVDHQCPHFNCPDVANYALKLVHGIPAGIMPSTHTTTVQVGAVIE
jgi:hypothetical protein